MRKCGNYQIIDFLSFLLDIKKGQQPSKVSIAVFSFTRKSMNNIGHISDWLLCYSC
jgi:hypothetical protein